MPKVRKAKTVSSDNSVTIDVEKLMVPGAIIIAGLMISLSVFLGIRSISESALISSSVPTITTAPADSPITADISTTIDDDAYLGNKETATVAIVEFSDYECPYCQLFFKETYSQLIKAYVDTGKAIYVYRDYIAIPQHNPTATDEATAAECVKKLAGNTKYFEFHDYVFTNTAANGDGIPGGKDMLKSKAVSLGIDEALFTQCLVDPAIAQEITKDETDSQTAGIRGTPGFVIGKLDASGNVTGYAVSGAQPLATFSGVIDSLLAQ